MRMTEPDYGYLHAKAGIKNKKEMVRALKTRIKGINMKLLAKDVSPFLFDASQQDRIVLFDQWLERGAR